MENNLPSARMWNYYPPVIQSIEEFKAIIDAESVELDNTDKSIINITNNAYLTTMDERRVEAWERVFNIKPIAGSSLDDRRETIIARIRGQGKLNTDLINSIVNVFTGGTAISYVRDSVLYVEITPPPNNKSYQFPNVEQELANKVPSHLGFKISRNYLEWEEVKKDFATWGDVKNNFTTWENVLLYSPFGT